MRAPEPVRGWRVVADGRALDGLATGDGVVLRFAPDDALVPGDDVPTVDDPDAIVVPETGFVGWELAAGEVAAITHAHMEWPLSTDRPTVAQGLVAQVPAKLWLRSDGSALLLCAAPYADVLRERLEGGA